MGDHEMLSADAHAAFEVLTDIDGSVVVRLVGELDHSDVPGLEGAVRDLLGGRGGRLVIDAAALEFVDSSMIALWVSWANQVGHVEIHDPSPGIRRVIGRMGLAERLRLMP